MSTWLETFSRTVTTMGEGRTTQVDSESTEGLKSSSSTSTTEEGAKTSSGTSTSTTDRDTVTETTTPSTDQIKVVTTYDDYALTLSFDIPLDGGLGNFSGGVDPCA